MFELYKELTVDSAHSLPNYDGICKNLHGHTWRVEVEIRVQNERLDDYDMVLDFNKVKEIVKRFDHCNINDLIDNPTAENIAEDISNRLEIAMGERFFKIKISVWETPTSCITYSKGYEECK